MIVVENKFTKTELHFVLNTLGRLSLNAEHKDCIGRILAKKKAAGIPINDQAMAIAISECKKSSKNADMHHISPIDRKAISSIG